MQARMFCPEHGKLTLEQIVIKNGKPICGMCQKELEFGTVRPRKITKKQKSQ